MANSRVNGRKISCPAGYDDFDYSKKTGTRNTQLQHGKGKDGFKAPQHAKIVIDGLYRAIYEYKENGKSLENVVRIKVQPNREQNRDGELSH